MYYLALGDMDRLAAPLAGRFRSCGYDRPVVRDLRPGQSLPETPNLPPVCRPYQRLHQQRWALPIVYACLATDPGGSAPAILLDNVPLDEDGVPWSTLGTNWALASPLAQVGWLAQIAQLWEPCAREGVAGALLDLENIGVQGWQVRLFRLESDAGVHKLSALAECWGQLSPLAAPLAAVIEDLMLGKITQGSQLCESLERLALDVGLGQITEVAAATHPGCRETNEDTYAFDGLERRYAVVCDGMGGHAGGEVASRIATESIEQDLRSLSTDSHLSPALVRRRLDECLQRANQTIFEINRSEQRGGTGQMGTTAVACLIHGPLLHLAHSGDSRAYLITRRHCQQLTVDQDVVNQEIGLARIAGAAAPTLLGGGTLTQAVGILDRPHFRPVARTWVLSEECLILLCTDGLSDGDLIEHRWQDAFVPLLDADLHERADDLIGLALDELGHDNITFVAFKYIPSATAFVAECAGARSVAPWPPAESPAALAEPSIRAPASNWFGLILGVILLATAAAVGIGYYVIGYRH